MGDTLEVNYYENEIESLNESCSESEQSLASDPKVNEEEVKNSSNYLRKKRKIQELKEKKRRKRIDSSESQENKLNKFFSCEEIKEKLLKNKPIGFSISNVEELKILNQNDFLSLNENKCPFIKAIKFSIPNPNKDLSCIGKNSHENGSPVVLIVSPSAIKATKIIKSISSKFQNCKIAKLFAKHIKVEDQIKMLSENAYSIAIGTPNRLNKLIELGALNLTKLKIGIIDIAEDEKKFTLLSLKDVKDDFYKLIFSSIQNEIPRISFAFINQQPIFSSKNKMPRKNSNLSNKFPKVVKRIHTNQIKL